MSEQIKASKTIDGFLSITVSYSEQIVFIRQGKSVIQMPKYIAESLSRVIGEAAEK